MHSSSLRVCLADANSEIMRSTLGNDKYAAKANKKCIMVSAYLNSEWKSFTVNARIRI